MDVNEFALEYLLSVIRAERSARDIKLVLTDKINQRKSNLRPKQLIISACKRYYPLRLTRRTVKNVRGRVCVSPLAGDMIRFGQVSVRSGELDNEFCVRSVFRNSFAFRRTAFECVGSVFTHARARVKNENIEFL